EDGEDGEKSFTNPSKPITATQLFQQPITNYVSRPLTKRDESYFETLLLRMSVSNGLPFTFFENQETKNVLTFIAPALKLPSKKRMSDQILPQPTKMLTKSIKKTAQSDKIGITATFNGWTNVKQEHLFGVVFITSS